MTKKENEDQRVFSSVWKGKQLLWNIGKRQKAFEKVNF